VARTRYPKIGRTIEFFDPVSLRLRPGKITGVNGDGTINVRGYDGRNFANIISATTRPNNVWGTRHPNLLDITVAENEGVIQWGPNGDVNETIDYETASPIQGTQSVRCTATPTTIVQAGTLCANAIKPLVAVTGQQYTFSVDVKQPIATANARIAAVLSPRVANGNPASSGEIIGTPVAIGAGVVRLSVTTTPTDPLIVKYYIKVNWQDLANNGDQFVLDNACVKQGSTTNYTRPVVIS
jgi:hypothetical protein